MSFRIVARSLYDFYAVLSSGLISDASLVSDSDSKSDSETVSKPIPVASYLSYFEPSLMSLLDSCPESQCVQLSESFAVARSRGPNGAHRVTLVVVSC